MSRSLSRSTSQPLAVATLIDFLYQHARGDETEGRLQREMAEALAAVDTDRSITRRLIDNFEKRPARDRITTFGKFQPGVLRSLSRKRLASIMGPSSTLSELRLDDAGDPIFPEYPEDTRFTIEYTGLYCRDDTNDRLFTSDEPYVITAAVTVEDGDNVVRTEMHPQGFAKGHYGDVDTGEWREGPIAACWSGPLQEVSLVSVVMEHDEGDPDAYREEVALIVTAAAALAKLLGIEIPEALVALAAEAIIWLIDSEDEEVGTTVTLIRETTLRLYPPIPPFHYKDTRIEAKATGPFQCEYVEVEDITDLEYHIFSRHTDIGEYIVTFRISADKQPFESLDPREVRPFNGGILTFTGAR